MNFPFLKPKSLHVAKKTTKIKPLPPIKNNYSETLGEIKNISQIVIKEYKEIFPHLAHPSTTDLLQWLYNRCLDAEQGIKILETEADLSQRRGV